MTEASETADERKKTSNYYRGFFVAEQRRPVVEHEPTLGQMVASGVFAALPMVLMYWLYQRSQRAASQMQQQVGKPGFLQDMMQSMQKMTNPAGARNFRVEVRDKTFKDVIGVPEALAEVKQYVDFLKEGEKFTRLGARLPKGCLLTGEPGTGKTLMAKAVAGEANVPFFSCSGADFIEVYAGSGPKRVRELFAEAKKEAPSVIFVDEIDAVGSRGNHGGSSGEENRTVNQLLAEMDGLQANEFVVVFAATNHPDNIDKALLREGRFDRKIELPMPDKVAREELLLCSLNDVITGDPNGRLKPKPTPVTKPADGTTQRSETDEALELAVDDPVEADPAVSNSVFAKRLAELTPGCSPATLVTIVNEAALAAAVSNAKRVELSHLLPAIDDVIVGKKHRSRMSAAASERVALHEAGHTLAAWMLPNQSDVIKVSITPRGQAAGFTQQVGREALDMQTDVCMFTDICVMLGGRIAESTRFANLSTGASDDFERATKSAVAQFIALGMSPHTGLLAFDHNRLDGGRMYQKHSEMTQAAAEREASLLVEAAFKYTTQLLTEKKDKLDAITSLLVEKKEVLREDLERLLGPRNTKVSSLDPRVRAALKRFIRGAEDTAALAKSWEDLQLRTQDAERDAKQVSKPDAGTTVTQALQ